MTQNLSITTFRYIPTDLTPSTPEVESYLDVINKELLTRLHNSGKAYVSNAIVDEKYLLQACIVNFRTSLTDIKSLPALVTTLGRDVDSELRPSTL